MSHHQQDGKPPRPLGRREFLRVGGLGAAALATGSAGAPTLAAEPAARQGEPGQAAQASPAPAQSAQAPPRPAQRSSPYHRNFDPVPASEPSMNFAAFTDTHVGQQNRSPNWDFAQHLDRLADDIMERTLPCEFVVHLGDGAFNSTAFVNGVGLPDTLKSNYRNNLKDYLISHVNVPFHYVGGNIDLTDYSHNPGPAGHDADPFVLMKTYINETELNNYPYAFMRNGILFLAVPEMDAEPWTRPATCEWLEFMTTHYHDATTIILSHQAIEDTTPADGAADSYRGQQDQAWWAGLFQRNPQIKMFLHGHNHMAGWYQGSQSSGFSRPVQDFGHEMVFASPFPQMSWLVDYNPVDSIVIFTISPRFITAKAWKQDGTRGTWCAGYDQTWVVPTTFGANAEDWYSFPFLIQDGETQQTDMKVLSAKTTLQLVGTGPVELFYDPYMETKGIHTNENILGFDDDLTSKVTATTPGMTVHGPHTITFPPKHEWDRYCHDGHGGPPYRLFAVGTTPAGRRQHHARARVGPDGAQRVPQLQLRLRDRRLPGHPGDDAGQALPGPDGPEPDQHEQAELPLHAARLEVEELAVHVELGGIGRSFSINGGLFFENSTYDLLENIKSGVAEWTTVFRGTMSNNLIIGRTSNDESRGDIGPLFPYVDILKDGVLYATFGSEAFTVQNELRYKTFQIQDTVTKFTAKHTLTFGFSAQKYKSDNVFWSCCPQSNYTYNSLEDFYADAAGYLANPNRTTSPVSLRRFKVRYSNVPGLDKPLQPLEVWYSGVYAQDEFRPRPNMTVTAGVRADVSSFANTAYQNAKADALTFRDRDGNPIQFQTGEMPSTKVLWSPRVALNWDVRGDQRTQVRLGTGLFTGPPLYVWISNQLGNTGVLIGEIQQDNTSAYPFNPNPDTYKPTNVTGAGAASFQLNVTDRDFRFPQVWRTNVGVDQRLPWGMTGAVEYIYTNDVNGYAYYDANLPAPQTNFNGVDNRPRWTSNRINNTAGNVITGAYVLTNQSQGSSWNLSASLIKNLSSGFSFRGAWSYGEARNTIDPGSTASSTFNNNQHAGDPNNPGLGWSGGTQGHRVFFQAAYSREYFHFGATTVSVFWEARPSQQNFTTRASYVYGGDINNDGGTANDLIYIPRDTSEMNFDTFTSGGRTYTAAEQAAAFEAYIQQDSYLKDHRGQVAERGGLKMPMAGSMDLSVMQQIFRNLGGRRHSGEIRLDITNFGNLLNSNWGVGNQTTIASTGANSIRILTNPAVDSQGRITYRMALQDGDYVKETFRKSAFLSDVYSILLSFRYTFN